MHLQEDKKLAEIMFGACRNSKLALHVWCLPYGAVPPSSCSITKDVERIQTCYVERNAWGSGVAASTSHMLKLFESNDKTIYNSPPVAQTTTCFCRHVTKASDWWNPNVSQSSEPVSAVRPQTAAWRTHLPSVLTGVVWFTCTAFKLQRLTWRPPLFYIHFSFKVVAGLLQQAACSFQLWLKGFCVNQLKECR